MTDHGYDSLFRPGLFAGQRAIVTGGGSGIGRCIAHELAALGAHVCVTGRKAEKVQGVAAEIAEDGGSATAHAFDIRDEDAVKPAVAAMLEGGPIRYLVNNAGGQFPSPLQHISRRGFEAVVSTNLTGGFLVARELFNQSLEKTGGAIVNITADFWDGMPVMGHSGAARAGMDNLTKTMAVEWARAGVRVNSVAPGWVASSGMDQYDPSFSRAMVPEMKRHVPLKRLATEAEISAPVVFLLSDAAAFITGAGLRVDGGASQGRPIFPLEDAGHVTRYQGFHRYVPPKAVQEIDQKGKDTP
ncbi:SDR family oxidoreductase [Yunchengibacter salinarum]|uniref:SDR family oxidoreductase n=1 Tax=Yunchengibacter salinarum TaxID=3133399 RepID=UPI0035B5B252